MPKKLREIYVKNITNAGMKQDAERYTSRIYFIGLIIAVFVSLILFFALKVMPVLSFFLSFIIVEIFFYFLISLKATARIKKIEALFPDFIQLMSSNLRAGMTVDNSFLSSARPELAPLDEEISRTGKEIATGQDIVLAFNNMAKRIDSNKIKKIIALIISGLRSGGNISTLLENTSSSMRERQFLEERAASNVLMYVIFIFIATGVGAPILFGLSSILVEVIINLTSNLPAASSSVNLPFTLSSIGISANFVIYFSLVFLITINIISSLIIGLVNKGDERYGLKQMFPLVVLSLSIFFVIRIVLYNFLVGSFSIIT